MKLLVALVALFVVAQGVKWHQLESYTFDHFVAEFGRYYENDEETQMRREIFERNLEKIRSHNKDTTKTWKLGVNKFADRTEQEFRNHLGLRKEIVNSFKHLKNVVEIPEANDYVATPFQNGVDWRTKGVVTAVKDQGACGSCWSFGSAETLESYWAIKTGKLYVLSEQQILDCTPNPNGCGGTGGCGGGTAELAYAQIKVMGGLATEADYPYVSGGGQNFQCQTNYTPVAKVTGYVNLPSNQEGPILTQLTKGGPLAISVDASAWSFYESGVFNGCDQQNPDIDHEVQLVGYGTDSSSGQDYWLVRNSWNSGWGEDGYIRLLRTTNPPCGIDTTPSDGDGCNNGPPQVTVCGTCGILYDAVFPTV
eukprot:TRINITY_DN9509_c0_g1_i1.p1 TRINITY_DN9509_c0_g1~~TRINITY_DN9509_c0_g1_i1.p1  ORF type:complete len:366 (-),score=103.41 TRINITY_DN9509_c0_g1_i1:117-1214(-)